MQQRYYDPAIGMFLSVDPVTAYSDPVGHFHRYRYATNNPYKFTDPDGRIAETLWDAANVGMGLASGYDNVRNGNYGAAAVDGLGVVIDAAATLAPFVPGGAGASIRVGRAVGPVLRAAKKFGATAGDIKGISNLARTMATGANGFKLNPRSGAHALDATLTIAPNKLIDAIAAAGFKADETIANSFKNGNVRVTIRTNSKNGVTSAYVAVKSRNSYREVAKIRLKDPR